MNKEIEILAKLKLKQPKGLKRFIYEKTDYRTNKTCKVSRYVATIEIWRGRILERTFAFISFEKEKTMKNMEITEVCRRVEGFNGCLLKDVYHDMAGKHVIYTYDDKEFWISKAHWNFDAYRMYSEQEIIDMLNIPYCQWDKARYRVYMEFFRYICAYRSEPKIELLVKGGFAQYVHCYKKLNLKEKSLSKIFRVNDYWLPYLKTMEYSDIMLIRNRKHHIKTFDDLCLVKGFKPLHQDEVRKYACPKMIAYIKKMKSEGRYDEWDYNDYLRFCEELGYDLNDYYILLPKDIKKEHDKLMKLVKIKKDKDSKEKFFKAYKKLLKYVYSSGNFVIIPCECLSDLEKESEELHHCVKTYAQRYQDQKTNIMFVRDVHEVTKPYATLEFKDKKVIQFRAKNNLRPSDEAVSFVREWADMNRLECNL